MTTTPKDTVAKTADATSAEAENQPIIVDMGKQSRKAVRKLRKGKAGKLLRRVEETVAHLRESGAAAEGVQTIVIVVRERPRGGRLTKMWGLG